ncbi:MAG: CapA family protein [Chloroflexota bacterium]|nr:CapA family protein [Chloroflexota bacterium]
MSQSGQVPEVPRIAAPLSLLAAAISLVLVIATSGDGKGDFAATARAAPSVKAPPRAEALSSVTIGWVGDTVLGSRHGNPPNGGRELLTGVRRLLREPDVMIGNLEGVIGTGGAAKCPIGTRNCFAFQAPPIAADTLAWAGFDVMNLANNHAYDYGAIGLKETISHLQQYRIDSTGAPNQITLLERNGISIAVLGFAPYSWASRLDDIPAAVALVKRAREAADVIVVTMHAGAEGTDQMRTPTGPEYAFGEARGDTRAFAHAVIDAGAHVVFGSGPHVIRGVERRKSRLILYSTGNFTGYNALPTSGDLALSALARVEITRAGDTRGGEWIPLRILAPGKPTLDTTPPNSAARAADLSSLDFAQPGIRANGQLKAGAAR